MKKIINLIIGLLCGYILAYIVYDQKITQQNRLIEKLNEDLAWEKHKNNRYYKMVIEEKERYLELLNKKYKEANNGFTR